MARLPVFNDFGLVGSVLDLRSGPNGSGQPVGVMWFLFRAKPPILNSFRTISEDLDPNRHCGSDLDLQDQAGDGPL